MSDADDAALTLAYASTPKSSSKSSKPSGDPDADALAAAYAPQDKPKSDRLTGESKEQFAHGNLKYSPWLDFGVGPKAPPKVYPNDPTAGGGNLNVAGYDTGIHIPETPYRFLAGTGYGMNSALQGIGQVLGTVSREDVKNTRELAEPLLATPAGKLGNLVGSGVAYAPAAMIPGANTALGGALIGGGVGLLAPSASSTETAGNVLGGVVGGPVINRAGAALGANASMARGGLDGIAPSLTQGAAHWSQQPTSMGAASASGGNVVAASPDLQEAYRAAVAQGQTPKPEVLSRHAEADSLPVPIRLTEGQATQSPAILSREMNRRGVTGLGDFHNAQDEALKANLQHLRDQVGPDVFTTNATEHGDTLIQAYKDHDAPIVADINAKYQALNDAAGGNFPVDGQTFAENARAALKKSLKSNFVPAGIESDLKAFESGEPMSFEQFEAMRTNLASEARDNPSGNARAAASIIRQQLEDLPLKGQAAELKPLADAARSAARSRFEALEADPAYRAAVEGTVPPDKFVPKFVTGGNRDQVALMRQNLGNNDRALQTMGVATLDDLRTAAGIDSQGNNAFNQARFNKRLEALSPKMQHLLPGEESQTLQTLGNVSRYVKAQPVGHVINNSNTLTGALAEGAGNLATTMVDAKTGGLASLGRKGWQMINKGKELQQTTKPLAGGFEEPK